MTNINDNEKAVVGTHEYMAPEILFKNEHRYGYQTDWWSFGILLYELHYKVSPFKASTIFEIDHNIMNNEVTFPSSETNTKFK